MIYSIVNAFCNNLTFEFPQAENILLATLKKNRGLAASMHQRIEKVFEPIFFEYPNGIKDRSVCEPRDTRTYIRQWREFAAMRTPYVAATEHSKELSKDQVSEIFRRYMEDLKKDLRPEQQGKTWTYYKGCTETKMRRMTGSVFVANVIWEIGLPRLPPFATEQRLPSATDLEAFPETIKSVLEWLDRIATALLKHHTTPE